MKKLMSILTAVLFVFALSMSFSSCGDDAGTSGTDKGTTGDNNPVTSQSGYALNFDGGDNVSIGDVAFLDAQDSFTFTAWFKTMGFSSGRSMIMSKDNSFEWFFNNHGQSINLRLNNGSYDEVNYSFTTDTWYHLAVVSNSNGKNYYINGELISTKGSQVALNNNDHGLYIGGRINDHWLIGSLDDVSIWNVGLSESEIQSIMNYELSGDENNLVAYYNFNEGSGSTLTDISGHDNNGNVVNATWVESGVQINSEREEYLKEEEEKEKEEVEEEDEEEASYYGVTNDPDGYTNVREEKSSKSEIVFKVYEGDKFEIIDNRDDNWWLIEYDGEQGYIYSDRIDIIK